MQTAVTAGLISFLCLCSCTPSEPGVDYGNPRVYNVDFTFELQPDPDSIDRATDLKLWLPVPREWDSQREVKILSVDPPPHGEYTDPEFGDPMFFWDFSREPEQSVYSVTLRYRLEAFDFQAHIDPSRVGAYDTTSDFYSLYTRSTEHIQITPEIRALAREAIGEEQNPHRQAKRIHDFVVRKVRYMVFRPDKISGTKALLETASVDEETGEVYYQGACNLMTQFFVALCRAVGIPARGVTGMVGWDPSLKRADLKIREERFTELSRDGLATARLFGPLDGHRWPEFYLPNYGWIPVDPTWGRFPLIDNRRIILSKGTDVLIGPGAPQGDGDGYGDQRILLRDGRVDAFGFGVWNLSKIRIANAKFLHTSDPFPADAFAGYGALRDGGDPWSGEPAFDGRELLRDIDEVTRGQAEKQTAWAEALKQSPWMEEPRQAFVLHMLHGIVGGESFVKIRDTYLALRHESGEAVPIRRFQDIVEEIHREPLDWFFQQWLEREELPELELGGVEMESDGEGWLVRGSLRQLNQEALRLPVDLEVTTVVDTLSPTTPGEAMGQHTVSPRRIERVWMDTKEASFQLRTSDRPARILVDPEFDLLKIQKMPPHLTTGYPNVLVVYGTLAESEANQGAAESFERGFLGLGEEVVKADIEVSDEDLKAPVLILFGRPETNLIAQRFAQAFPVRFDGAAFTYDGVTYQEPSQGVSQVIEKPEGLPGLMVLHAGLSGEATRRVCDKPEWREGLGGWFLVDMDASYVIYDTDEHRPLAFGDWEGFDSDLVWRADEAAREGPPM